MKVLGDALTKSRDVKAVELNSTMGVDAVARLLKDISDHAKANSKSDQPPSSGPVGMLVWN